MQEMKTDGVGQLMAAVNRPIPLPLINKSHSFVVKAVSEPGNQTGATG